MCGIVGFVNYKQDISNYKNILENMNNALSRKGTDEKSYYLKKHVAINYKNCTIMKTPISEKRHNYSFL